LQQTLVVPAAVQVGLIRVVNFPKVQCLRKFSGNINKSLGNMIQELVMPFIYPLCIPKLWPLYVTKLMKISTQRHQ